MGLEGRRFLRRQALSDSIPLPVTTCTYAPFGETNDAGAGPPDPVRFTGREENGSGLYSYRARYYDPTRSRFVSEDPIGFAGGDVNLYAYVGANPSTWADPLGFYGWDVHYYLTYKLAREVGLDARIAGRIATANQSVDDSPFQSPYSPLSYLGGFALDLHFGRRGDAELGLMRCSSLGQVEEFGRTLHRLQDTFSHQGLNPYSHARLGSAPDRYFEENLRDQEMTRATREWLRRFKEGRDRRTPRIGQ
jgi:RHS repeat-associated protein